MNKLLTDCKLAFIGCGVMAESIVAGLLRMELVAPTQITASHPRTERRKELEKKYKIQIQSCDFFDYRVEYEWSELDPKKPTWSEKRREVIPATGIVAEFHKFQKNNAPFFV